MNCRFVSEQLSAYLDDELEPGLAREVKEHLDGCEACRKELESLRELTGILHALPRASAPEDTQREVISRIERALLLGKLAARPRLVTFRRVLGGAALAAAVTLLALGAYIKFFPGESRSTTPTVWDNRDDLALREKADTTLARAGKPTGKPAEAGGEGNVFEETRDRKLAFNTEGSRAREGETVLGGRIAALPSTTKGVEVKETPAAPEVAQPDRTLTGTPAKPAPNLEGPTLLEPVPTAHGELAKRSTDQPPLTEALRDDELRKVGKPEAKKPAEPEVLNLVVAAEDFEAAKKHILSVADSLQIRTVSDLSFGVTARRTTELEGLRTGKTPGPAVTAGAEARGKPASAADADEYQTAVRKVDEGRPVLVLAVEEQKLPQLVAKLAARRLAGLAEQSSRYFYSVAEERAKEGEVRAEQKTSAAAAAPTPGEKSRETGELAVKDVHVAPARTPAPATPAPAEVSKQEAEDASKLKQTEVSRLIYIRIFLTHPEPAVETKPAKESPAK